MVSELQHIRGVKKQDLACFTVKGECHIRIVNCWADVHDVESLIHWHEISELEKVWVQPDLLEETLRDIDYKAIVVANYKLLGLTFELGRQVCHLLKVLLPLQEAHKFEAALRELRVDFDQDV